MCTLSQAIQFGFLESADLEPLEFSDLLMVRDLVPHQTTRYENFTDGQLDAVCITDQYRVDDPNCEDFDGTEFDSLSVTLFFLEGKLIIRRNPDNQFSLTQEGRKLFWRQFPLGCGLDEVIEKVHETTPWCIAGIENFLQMVTGVPSNKLQKSHIRQFQKNPIFEERMIHFLFHVFGFGEDS